MKTKLLLTTMLFISILGFSQIPTSGLVQRFTFDNTLSNSTTYSTFSVAGTAVSYAPDRFGITNKAVEFTAGSLISTGVTFLPSAGTARSISLWIRPSVVNSDNILFTYGNASGNTAFGGSFNTTKMFNFTYDSNVFANSTMTANEWKHYLITYNGTTSKVYINGALVNQGALSVNTGSTSALFYLGSNFTNSAGRFSGRMDDLLIYNRVLTDAEVLQIYNETPAATAPAISAISSTITNASANITYTLSPNLANTTSIIKYGTSSGALTNQVTGFSASATTTNSVSIPGLDPSTQYFYEIEATNSVGTTTSAINNFTTTNNVNGLIQEWKFNNSRTNESGDLTFPTSTNSNFTTDRNGVANNALLFWNNGTNLTVPNLPVGSSPRTVSIWVKVQTYEADPALSYAFSYGGSTTNTAYGLAFSKVATSTIYLYNYGWGNDMGGIITPSLGTWNHYVTTFDGTTAKMYMNGNQIFTSAKNWNTGSKVLRLAQNTDGTNTFFGSVDDLKIYDRALSAIEVSDLYSGATLATSESTTAKSEINIFPNPSNDEVNIEMTNEVDSIEIYTILGQKVLESKSKKVNVSSLATGIYMVRIKDTENATLTKKFIKN